MDAGVWILGSAFGGAALLVGGCLGRRRAAEARLRALGFEPCPGEAGRLRRAWTELAGGRGDARVRHYHVGRCFVRRDAVATVHRFTATDLAEADRERRGLGGPVDVFLVAPPNPAGLPAQPVCVVLAPRGPRFLRAWLERRVQADPYGPALALSSDRNEARAFLAAFGAAPGRLEEALSPALRQRLVRAAAAGFLVAHLGGAGVALATRPERADLARQWRHVAEWLPAPA